MLFWRMTIEVKHLSLILMHSILHANHASVIEQSKTSVTYLTALLMIRILKPVSPIMEVYSIMDAALVAPP